MKLESYWDRSSASDSVAISNRVCYCVMIAVMKRSYQNLAEVRLAQTGVLVASLLQDVAL